MKRTINLTLLAFFITSLPLAAIDLDMSKFDLNIESVKYNGTDFSKNLKNSEDIFDIDASTDQEIFEYKYKSPKKAFLLSLLVPGLGQRYSGSGIWRSLLFVAFEAGSWAGYVKYNDDGNNKTTEYEKWAAAHWFEGDISDPDTTDEIPYPNLNDHTYRGWLLINQSNPDQGHVVVDDEDTLARNVTELTHHLPDSRNQQYYEMIGKYEQFRGGWDDYWTQADTTLEYYCSPHRSRYINLRDDANTLLDRANKLMIVAMINHLVSAFDAAMAASRFNKSQSGDTWTLQAEMKKYSATEEIPILKFTRRF